MHQILALVFELCCRNYANINIERASPSTSRQSRQTKKKRSNRILHRLSSQHTVAASALIPCVTTVAGLEPIFALGPRYCIVPLRYIRFRRQNYATCLSLSDCVDLQWSGVFWELWKLNGVNWEDTLSKLLTGSKHPVSSVSSFFVELRATQYARKSGSHYFVKNDGTLRISIGTYL